MTGVVRKIHLDKGFFFIKGEDGKDYFAHRSACKNCRIEQLHEGQDVTFEDAEGPKGLRAEDVYV